MHQGALIVCGFLVYSTSIALQGHPPALHIFVFVLRDTSVYLSGVNLTVGWSFFSTQTGPQHGNEAKQIIKTRSENMLFGERDGREQPAVVFADENGPNGV